MNKKGISAVIGVLLMVAITVASACTVYVYVSGILDTVNEPIKINGTISDKFIIGDCECNQPHYYFILNNTELQVNITIYYKYNIGDYYEKII